MSRRAVCTRNKLMPNPLGCWAGSGSMLASHNALPAVPCGRPDPGRIRFSVGPLNGDQSLAWGNTNLSDEAEKGGPDRETRVSARSGQVVWTMRSQTRGHGWGVMGARVIHPVRLRPAIGGDQFQAAVRLRLEGKGIQSSLLPLQPQFGLRGYLGAGQHPRRRALSRAANARQATLAAFLTFQPQTGRESS
jgi:hypothetical protein